MPAGGPQDITVDPRQPVAVVLYDPVSHLYYTIASGTGGTSSADESTFTYGTSSFTPIGGVAATSVAAMPAGQGLVAKVSPSNRSLATEPYSPSGTTAMDVSTNALRVNVVAGGAGGGVAQTQIRNAADSAWVNVGYATASTLLMPVLVSSIGAGVLATVSLVGATPSGNAPIGQVKLLDAAGTNLGAISASGYVLVDPAMGLRNPTMGTIQTAASGVTAIIPAPGASVRVKIYGYEVVAAQAVTFSFVSPTGTFLTGSIACATNGGIVRQGQIGAPLYIGGAGATVYINLSGAFPVGGSICYYLEQG